MKTRRLAAVAGIAVIGLALAGCSGGSSGGSSGGGDASKGLTSRGPITYVQGKDNSNVVRPLIAKWNAAHPDEKVTFKEQSDQADQQHDDLVQHFQAKDADYDVVDVDVVWTAEFAAKGWLTPLAGKMKIDTVGAAAVDRRHRDLQQHAVRGAADLRRRPALLPHRPRQDPAEDVGRDDGRLRHRQEERHRLLRRPVRQVRRSHRQRLRGDQRRRRLDRGQGRQDPDRRQPRGQEGPAEPGRRVQGRQHPGRGDHVPGGAGPQAFEDGKLLFLRNWPYVYTSPRPTAPRR